MSSLRIAIDGNEANVKKRVGSNVYAFEIITALEKITRNQPNINVTVMLAQPALSDLPSSRLGWEYRVIKPTQLWTQLAAPIYLFWHQAEYDVWFTPGHYAPRFCPIPYVSSVMDLAYLHFPDQFRKNDLIQLTDWTKYSVKQAKKIIAISEFTKQDIIKHYHRQPTDVIVAYPSLAKEQQLFNADRRIFSKFKIDQPYFLYVGTIQPRKNLLNLIEAFEIVSRFWESNRIKIKSKKRRAISAPPVQLVIAGKIGWLAEAFLQRVQQSPFIDHIKIIGYVSNREKQILYENAMATMLVGLYEGFGMPPLESMSVGTPVIVANQTSLPEVVGKAGVQVNPNSAAAIAQGMKQVLLWSAKQRAQMRRLMRSQVKKFDWQQSAQIILQTLHRVAGK